MQINHLFDLKALRVTDAPGLDPISVFIRDTGPSAGQIIIECYGRSWTAFWGSMGNNTVADFFEKSEVDYIVRRMVDHTLPQKKLKEEMAYLTRIVLAVQAALRLPEATLSQTSIQHDAAALHSSAERDLTPEQWARVQSAKAGIRGVVDLFGDAGKVALSLCAADFAAE